MFTECSGRVEEIAGMIHTRVPDSGMPKVSKQPRDKIINFMGILRMEEVSAAGYGGGDNMREISVEPHHRKLSNWIRNLFTLSVTHNITPIPT
jgi:hypothetical protein